VSVMIAHGVNRRRRSDKFLTNGSILVFVQSRFHSVKDGLGRGAFEADGKKIVDGSPGLKKKEKEKEAPGKGEERLWA